MGNPPPKTDAPPLLFSVKSISRLSRSQVSSLEEPELVALIRAVEYPFAGKERLEFFDRDTLVRVAHLVCRWCRNTLGMSPGDQAVA